MQTKRDTTISLRQAGLLFISLYLSVAIRLEPVVSSQYAQQAAPLAPLVSFLIFVLVIELLRRLFRQDDRFMLPEKALQILGPRAGMAALTLAGLWFTFQAALYLRSYSIQLTSTIFPTVRPAVFVFLMLLPVGVVIRKGPWVLSRMNDFIVVSILVVLGVIALGVVKRIDLQNLQPITWDSVLPVARAGVYSSGHWVALWVVFFLCPIVRNRGGFHPTLTLRTGLLLLAASIVIIVMTVGSLSSRVVNHLSLPFIFAVKQIEIASSLQKVEAPVITMWILSDFVNIAVYSMAGMRILRKLTAAQEGDVLVPLYMAFILFLAMALTTAPMELIYLSVELFLPISAALGVGFPLLLVTVQAIRRRRGNLPPPPADPSDLP